MALEDLMRYESAAVAAMNVEKEKDLAVLAIESQYRSILGDDYETDPIIKRNIAEARAGLAHDSISNIGVLEAIQVYTGKYEKAFNSTKFSDLTKYLTEGYKVSEEVKKALDKYKELTIKELAEKQKEKATSKQEAEEMGKAVKAVSILKERRLRAKTLDIYNGVVKRNLEGLYPIEKSRGD